MNEFYQRIRREAEALTTDFEVSVNDGLPEHAPDIPHRPQRQDTRAFASSIYPKFRAT